VTAEVGQSFIYTNALFQAALDDLVAYLVVAAQRFSRSVLFLRERRGFALFVTWPGSASLRNALVNSTHVLHRFLPPKRCNGHGPRVRPRALTMPVQTGTIWRSFYLSRACSDYYPIFLPRLLLPLCFYKDRFCSTWFDKDGSALVSASFLPRRFYQIVLDCLCFAI